MRVATAVIIATLLVTGCTARPAPPGVTAVLHGDLTCATRCTHWFEYWPDGGATATTPLRVTTDSGPVTATVTGLLPDTVYRSRLCTYGDTALPGVCHGQPNEPPSVPGKQPPAGDLSATRNLRTASEGTAADRAASEGTASGGTASGGTAAEGAGEGTAATRDLGRPLSDADTASRPISRDAGLSAAWSEGRSLWLFGDTVQRGGPEFLPGTTAALGSYERGVSPISLREVPTPPESHAAGPAEPRPFLPVPSGLRAGPGEDCAGGGRYPAAWPSGVARMPGTERLLISFVETCVLSPTDMRPQRVGLVVYDPVANRFEDRVTPFAAEPLEAGLPVALRLGSPVFGGDGHLYLYAHDTSRVLVARVGADPAAWGDPAGYRWWDGTWTPDPNRAVPVVSVPFAGSVHVAAATTTAAGEAGVCGIRVDIGAEIHTRGWCRAVVMIVQTGFGTGRFQVFEAETPGGPWRAGVTATVPDACSTEGYGCYALAGHAELSTAERFVFSWYSPTDLFTFGHIRLGSVSWRGGRR